MNLIQRIDALLPQTQCGKCGHPGCKPYAEGIANGEAINMAQTLEIDAVIDPADTRNWLVRGLQSASRGVREATPYVDTW